VDGSAFSSPTRPNRDKRDERETKEPRGESVFNYSVQLQCSIGVVFGWESYNQEFLVKDLVVNEIIGFKSGHGDFLPGNGGGGGGGGGGEGRQSSEADTLAEGTGYLGIRKKLRSIY